jgi:hypothetical protein
VIEYFVFCFLLFAVCCLLFAVRWVKFAWKTMLPASLYRSVHQKAPARAEAQASVLLL